MYEVVVRDGRFYHSGAEAAPYGWARHDGTRVELEGKEGQWVEIFEDQKPFEFSLDNHGAVTVTAGFMNNEFNGNTMFPIALLLSQDLDEIKAYMKRIERPSCTRLNLMQDFLRFYVR